MDGLMRKIHRHAGLTHLAQGFGVARARSGTGLMVMLMALVMWVSPAEAQQVPAADLVQTCVPCHGRDGIARDSEVPHLAGQNERYLLLQMQAFRSGARKHAEMRYITRHMEPAELEALAAYFAALPPR
jgi:cytochrome c553